VGADVEQISVSGTALNFAAIDQTAAITVHNIHNERELLVKVESVTGNPTPIPVTLKQEADSVRIEFTPRSPGEHAIHLTYRGMPLPGSPFVTKVYNIKEISVKEMPKEIVVGKPVTFLG
jgi:hypothetical protein